MTIIYPDSKQSKEKAKELFLKGQFTLKMYLAWKDWTPKEFAQRACIHYSTIYSILTGSKVASERISKAIETFTEGLVVLPFIERKNKSKKLKKTQE